MKKLFVMFGAVAFALVGASLFAAFEAHVVNVTATIENALRVPVDSINFGTVFPQEKLDKTVDVTLSDSFKAQSRVDTVTYMIRQKPKCGFTTNNGTVLVGPTRTGEVVIDTTPAGYHVDCGTAPTAAEVPQDAVWGVLPSLCPYLSKHSNNANDVNVPAFHLPFTIVNGQIVWTEAKGTLTNPGQPAATWTIDLKVPCFGGQCAQDWADFVHAANPDATPVNFIQNGANEHKVFGCDLWFETTGVTHSPVTPPAPPA